MSENHLGVGNIELVLRGLFVQSHLEDSDEGRTEMSIQWTGDKPICREGSMSPLIFRIQSSAYGGT